MKSRIDDCIKCSICNAYCPVLRETGLFPGPKLAGPDAQRFRREGQRIPAEWLAFCDYCKICERVCPQNVPIPELHLRSRHAAGKKPRPSLRDYLLGHAYIIEKIGSWGFPLSNSLLGWAFFRWLLDRGLGIDRRIRFPLNVRPTFAHWFRTRPAAEGRPVAYFHGCYTNYMEPALGQAVVEVLEKNGFKVILPRQECCGLPLIGNDLFDQASRLAKKNIKSLRAHVNQGMEVIYSSSSCGMTLAQEYTQILDLSEAAPLAPHLYEVSQFLLRLYEEGKLNTRFKEIRKIVYYHAPCHLRSLQIGLPALDLLSLIPGLKVFELPEGCCGLAGTYGFKKEKYAIASRVGEEIFQAVKQSGAEIVVSDCEACRMQIGQHTGVKTSHPIQILRRAYGE